MSRLGVYRVPGDIQRSAPVPHDRWLRDRSTGAIDLAISTLPGRFVSPGTGRLVLTDHGAGEVVAQQAAHSKDQPILPGSGIKGAVRTLYELLSISCNPFDFNAGCQRFSACDACSLFGLRGWTGRVSFSDAIASPEGTVTEAVAKVPAAWEPDGSKTNGDFRLYDLGDGESAPAGRGAPERPPYVREVFAGRFSTRLYFINATDEELGRLLLCLGLGDPDRFCFPLRLGGVKYAGQGAVSLQVERVKLRFPDARSLAAEPSATLVAKWIAQALDSAWGATFSPKLAEVASGLKDTKGDRP